MQAAVELKETIGIKGHKNPAHIACVAGAKKYGGKKKDKDE